MLSLKLCHFGLRSDRAHISRSYSSSSTRRNWKNVSRLSSTMLLKAIFSWKESFGVENKISHSIVGIIYDTQKWALVTFCSIVWTVGYVKTVCFVLYIHMLYSHVLTILLILWYITPNLQVLLCSTAQCLYCHPPPCHFCGEVAHLSVCVCPSSCPDATVAVTTVTTHRPTHTYSLKRLLTDSLSIYLTSHTHTHTCTHTIYQPRTGLCPFAWLNVMSRL